MKYTCPVCGYNRLDEPPEDYEICPSCGTQFGYNDAAPTPSVKHAKHLELRQRWLEAGGGWFDYATPKPFPNWNAYQQLMNAGFIEVEAAPVEDEPSVNIVDFGEIENEVCEGITLYERLIAVGVGDSNTDFLERVHYAAA